MTPSRFQQKQQALLERARRGALDRDNFVRSLYSLLQSQEQDDTSEQLDPEWSRLWKKYSKERLLRLYPDYVIDQIESELAKISDADTRITEICPGAKEKVCVLLGAGASAPAIPTVAQLLPELWSRARRLGREEIDRLVEWCDNHSIKNIEDLLTAAYIANYTAKNTAVTGLLDFFLFQRDKRRSEEEEYSRTRGASLQSRVDTGAIALLQDTLQILFGLLTGTMIPADPNPAHKALATFVKTHPNTSIVTTNYDGCVDEALLQADIPINTYIGDETDKEEDVSLIKIHGSINWSYCDSCHDVREFDLLHTKKAYVEDTLSYAVIGICKKCQGQRRPLLIPPLGLKFIMFPNLIRLWDKARSTIEQAQVLVVVGYSFAEADTYVNKIIERSMTMNEKQRMVVCDTNADLAPSLRKKFSARIDGFDEGRVLSRVGSAHEVLPYVLDLLAGKKAPKNKEATTPKVAKKRARTRRSTAQQRDSGDKQ